MIEDNHMNPIKIGRDRYLLIGTAGQVEHTHGGNSDHLSTLTAKELDQLVARVEWEARHTAAPKCRDDIHCGEPITIGATGVACAGYNIPIGTLKLLQAASHRVLQNRKRKTRTHKSK